MDRYEGEYHDSGNNSEERDNDFTHLGCHKRNPIV